VVRGDSCDSDIEDRTPTDTEHERNETAERSHKSLTEYVQAQEQLTRHLQWQVEVAPGGERTLKESLQNNNRLQVASNGSLTGTQP